MGIESIEAGIESSDEIEYQIISSDGIVQIDLSKESQDLALATDRDSALLLASDILTAVNQTD